ncbi:MAG: hypothetical protein AAF829_09385 [Pseudomonadota bacterium]
MGDKIFFPLIVLFAAGLVALALSPQLNALPSGPVSVGDLNYNEVEVSGLELNRMKAGGDAQLVLQRDGPNQTALEIVTTAGLLSSDPRLGPHFELAADIEVQFSGFEIEVAVTAKPGEVSGALQMQVNYSTGREGESGWQIFDLQPGWETFRFTYPVPVKSGENALDYIAIRPVTPDKSRSILIDRIEFTRGQRWAVQEG